MSEVIIEGDEDQIRHLHDHLFNRGWLDEDGLTFGDIQDHIHDEACFMGALDEAQCAMEVVAVELERLNEPDLAEELREKRQIILGAMGEQE